MGRGSGTARCIEAASQWGSPTVEHVAVVVAAMEAWEVLWPIV